MPAARLTHTRTHTRALPQVCRTTPAEKGKYIKVILSLLQSSSAAVVYECAVTLVSLSQAPSAIRAAANCFCQLLVSQSDNNVKLILLDRLTDLKNKHREVMQVRVWGRGRGGRCVGVSGVQGQGRARQAGGQGAGGRSRRHDPVGRLGVGRGSGRGSAEVDSRVGGQVGGWRSGSRGERWMR